MAYGIKRNNQRSDLDTHKKHLNDSKNSLKYISNAIELKQNHR